MKLSQISFCGQPQNYAVIDRYLSRSAQPQREDFAWLKEQGVTDIFNFRTMSFLNIDFDEKLEVEKLGLIYHNIPSISAKPSEENADKFLSEIEGVIKRDGKAHIHCMAGADRTGMYSLIYKLKNGLCSWKTGVLEMNKMGHNSVRYPNLISWIEQYLQKNFYIKK